MYFIDMIEEIKMNFEVSLHKRGNQHEILDIVFLNFCPVSWSEYTLYIGDSSMLHPEPDRPIMLLTTGHESIDDLLPQGSSLGIIKGDLYRLYNSTKDILYRDLKSQSILFRISEEALNGKDVVSLINTAATLLGNALILADNNMKVLVYSTDIEIMDPSWAENIKRGQYSYEFIQKVKVSKDMQEWKKSDGETKIITLDEDNQPKLVARITQAGHIVGGLVMIAHHTPINYSHEKLLTKIGRILFDSFNHIYDGNTSKSLHSTILYHLLSGDDISNALDLSDQPNTNFPKEMTVVVARFLKRTENRYLKRTVGFELERIFPNGYPVQYKSYIAILVTSISTEQREELHKLAESEEINIGISWSFTNILDFKKYFNQAVSSIKQAQIFGVGNQVLDYTDYSFYDLLYNYSGKIALEDFCHPALQILKDYDKANNTELFTTLDVYLKCNRNLGVTAEALYLHRNSISYRISRIVDLTGIDLNDINTISALVDSYRIQHFLTNSGPEVNIRKA